MEPTQGEDGTRLAREIPEIDRWYEALGPGHKRTAERLFGRINRVLVDDEGDRRRPFIGGVLAFESLGPRDMLDLLGCAGAGGGESMDTLRDIVAQLDDFDASAYYQTAKIRLGLIDNLVDATGDDDLARVAASTYSTACGCLTRRGSGRLVQGALTWSYAGQSRRWSQAKRVKKRWT